MAIQKTGILVDTDPAFPNQTVFEQSGQQSMITAIGLEPDTTYHVKGYVVVDGERVYSSNTKQFTTQHVEFFTIKNTANADNTIGITKQNSPNVTLEYSIDGGQWTTWSTSLGNLSLSVPSGKSVKFRGDNATLNSTSGRIRFTSTLSCELSGDLTTIISKNGNVAALPNYAFYYLFQSMSNADINGLILPSTTVGDYGYASMFYQCTSLTTAPSLPATTISQYCYNAMFQGCTSLTTAPTLPATTLSDYCYTSMFQGCTSLTTAPTLPATTLSDYCYYSMFRECSSLTSVPALNATTLASDCYRQMFYGCTSLTSVPSNLLPATSLTEYCYQGMFYGCTALANAPSLNATTLADKCYNGMFSGCTALATAPASLPATTLYDSCYREMFYRCTSLTTAPNLSATTLANYCCYNMFNGCTALTTAPILYGTTPVSNCYSGMFRNCSSLNKIITYATTWGTSYASNWVNSVADTGDFYNLGQANIPIDNVSGVPIGWTLHTTLADYMTLTNTANGQNTIRVTRTGNPNITLDYTTDNGSTWTTWTSSTDLSITLDANGSVKFKGTNATFNASSNYIMFNSSDTCSVSGDINTLLNEVGGDIALPVHAFSHLFDGMTNLTNGGIILPSTTIANYCYAEMFRNTAIATAPSLPATTIAIQSYQEMFSGCTSLVNAPSLPATTLAEHCYDAMFSGCTGLLTVPATLSATTLAEYCYARMFKGCTALTTAPTISAISLADHCCSEMFNGCTALTTAPTTLPATTLAEYCYTMMFYHCTSLTTAPELPATVLADYCYWEMFNGCTSLNKVITYASDISATDCLLYWLSSVAASGDFYNLGGATYPSGASGIPYGWTVHTSL